MPANSKLKKNLIGELTKYLVANAIGHSIDDSKLFKKKGSTGNIVMEIVAIFRSGTKLLF